MTRWIPLLLLSACAAPPPGEPCDAPLSAEIDGRRITLSADGCARLELEARALGDGNLDLRFAFEDGVLRAFASGGAAGGSLAGVVLDGDVRLDGGGDLVWLRQGYQSWAFSGVVELTPWTLDAQGVAESGADGDTGTFLADRPWSSWWGGVLGRPGAPGDPGAGLLIGALDAGLHPVRLAAQPGDDAALQVVWGGRGERVSLPAGEEIPLEPLLFATGRDPGALPSRWAEAVAARRPPPALGRPDTGWSTWYVFYEDVVEADVRANLELLAARQAPLGVIQVDDGWQRVWGDWRADDGFPSGMDGLAGAIADAGYQPGLWMAPLYVDRSTTTYQDHPDWWVRELDGAEKRFTNVGTGDYAVLDVTVPAARAWLTGQIAGRVAEGWTYLKLDFLYAGAEEGQRAGGGTGMQAYAQAMQAIADGAGPGVTLLASGAPMLPSVGWFHAFRSGADIAFSSDPDPRREYLRWSARSTAARWWQNGVWWWNDPDAVLLRAPFDDAEARGALVAQIVSGGAYLLGDDLPSLAPDRLDAALAAPLLALVGQRFAPDAPFDFPSGFESSPLLELARGDDQVPTTWRADGVVALLNLTDRPLTLRAPAGTELLTGATRAEAGDVTLAAGDGQLWRR